MTTTKPSPAREAAEIAKIQAETAELLLQQELRQQEVRKARAEAAKEENQAAISAISLKERERVEEFAKIQDHYSFHHMFEGTVDERTVFPLLNTMSAWDRQYPECPMNITINSPGGSVIDGMHLFDQITAYSVRGGGKHFVTMTVRGYAASMAGILLQSADERVIGPESYLMIHEVSTYTGGKIGEIKDEVKFLELVSDRVANIFVERSKGKISKKDFVAGWERKEWWLDSKEALRLGFVDRIG